MDHSMKLLWVREIDSELLESYVNYLELASSSATCDSHAKSDLIKFRSFN